MDPIKLLSNQPPQRFYKGGSQISDFRSQAFCKAYTPEDWIASTTSCHGHPSLGQTRLPTNGILLKDEIENRPLDWLGRDHVKAFGPDTNFLVKLLDAGQRLRIHAHPHAEWARINVGAKHGNPRHGICVFLLTRHAQNPYHGRSC